MDGIRMRTANPTDRVALRGVAVHAALVGLAQRTRVEQTFVNLEPVPVEAVYTFPLPEGAAVCAFEVVTGDRVLTGVVDDSDAAIERYESAVADGHAAYLAEQERPDVFTVRVGNLKPGQAATIRLTHVRPLEVVDGSIRVAFPTTLAPRYTTASGTDPLDAAIDGDALNPPHVLDVPYGLKITADVRLGRRVRGISSPTHAVTVIGDDDDGYTVSLADAAMDREVVLSIDLAADVGTHVAVERCHDDAHYLAVTFSPEFAEAADAPPAPAEVVFVVDCSGSMEGESIAQATAALELCLRTLNVGDTFNVCRFGSAFELMSPEPLPYTDATLDRAVDYVRRTGAYLGGTELLAPLEAVLRPPPAAGRVRTVVLLTDGQVTNEPAVLALARRHRGRNRIFPFGIGPAVSTFLVNGLARATGGAAEFVAPGERVETKVLRTFARVASPVATDVTVDWGGADVQTLAELPPVFDGDVVGVFGRCAGKLPDRVTLRCRTAAGEQAWSAAVPTRATAGDTVATMWARRAIQSLEEVNGVGRSARLSPGSREAAEVVRLSRAFGLLSSLTTFVAVEHRSPAERNEGRPATRRVPVVVPAGWGQSVRVGGGGGAGGWTPAGGGPLQSGVRSFALRKASGAAAAAGSPPAPAPVRPPVRFVPKPGVIIGPTVVREEVAVQAVAPTVTGLSRVLVCQSAKGAFAWSNELDDLARVKVDQWDRRWAEAEARLAPPTDPAVLATAKALALLRLGFPADQPIWRRAGDKAARFLAASTGRSPADVAAWLASM